MNCFAIWPCLWDLGTGYGEGCANEKRLNHIVMGGKYHDKSETTVMEPSHSV